MAVVAFDSLGTLFDLGDLEGRMPHVLLHAVSLTVVGAWAPLDELVGLEYEGPFDDFAAQEGVVHRVAAARSACRA